MQDDALSYNDYENAEHALAYLAGADKIPHRTEGESVLLSFIPPGSSRILDLGTGDGRLLSLLRLHCNDAVYIGVDSSTTMVKAAHERFRETTGVEILLHDLEQPLPDIGEFDAIVSSFAIHHCTNERKQKLYREVFDRLTPGGVFCNLEHVASPSARLHRRFLDRLGITPEDEDKGNILLDVESQLTWLREVGFDDVDCYWKWLELCLFGGLKPAMGV